MATYNRYSYLATSGDLPVKAGGAAVFTANGLNVRAGEMVVFNPKTNLTVDAVDVLDQESLSIAVGVGRTGHVAESLRYLAGEQFDLCKGIISADVTRPNCAVPETKDVFFDCTKCDKQYTFGVYLDDSLVRSRYTQNEKAKYIYTLDTECGGCDECDVTVDCATMVTSFVDQVNMKFEDDPTKLVHFQRRDISHFYQPFRALPLYDASDSLKSYCFSLGDDTCEECNTIADGIGGISINGEVTTFTNTLTGTDTLTTQMDQVITQINAALEAAGVGLAYLTKGLHKCCDFCIQLSSSATILLRDNAGVTIEPSSSNNPFDNANGLTCGFRLIAQPVSVNCLCDWPANLPVPNYYGRTIEVQPLGDGWVKDNFLVVDVEDQDLPEGFGYFYQDKERYQHNGGRGKDYRYSNRRVGIIGLPDEHSRDANTTIICDEVYCVYNILSTATKNLKFNNAASVTNTDASWVLIPQADTTTRASWETYLAELNKNGLCTTANVTCSNLV